MTRRSSKRAPMTSIQIAPELFALAPMRGASASWMGRAVCEADLPDLSDAAKYPPSVRGALYLLLMAGSLLFWGAIAHGMREALVLLG